MELAYKPEWAKYEKDISNPNPEIASKAAEAFDETRREEMKNDPKARRWEQERKEAFLKDKPAFTKQRLAKEKSEYEKTLSKYLNGGMIMGKFVPSPGFVLVKPVIVDKTKAGILLPAGVDTSEVGEPNKGLVVAIGKEKHFSTGLVLEAPAKEGDVVMFKWNTMKMLYNGEIHNYMSFEDVMGRIEE